MGGIVSVVIGGIATVAAVYLVINHSSGVSTIAKGATSSYAQVAKTFQGG